MALTATFAADFDRFESALKSATFDLQTFDRATSTAMQKLKKETEGFSGQKVAVEATRMAEAVRRLGEDGRISSGLIKLLPEELKRVSAALETAAAKAKLMGETLPPSLQKMREEIAKMPQATTSATTGISSLATAFKSFGALIGVTSIVGAATAITRLGMSAIESASQIVDLSASLGVSTDAIQEMQAVANLTGTSIETFAAATFKLGVNVAEGSTKARDAIKDLGLSYQDLKRQLPEDQFRAVIKALEDVDTVQERNRLGVALFGKQFKEIATAVENGYSQMADSAAKSSREQLESLEHLGDEFDRIKGVVSTWTRSVLGDMALAAEAIALAGNSLSTWERFKILLSEGGLAGYTAKLQEMGERMRELNEAADRIIRESKLKVPEAATAAATDYAQALADINAKIADLEPEELKQLHAAIALGGEAAKEYAESIGLGADGLEVFKDHTAKATAALKELNKDMAESVVWGGGIAEADHWMEELAKHARELESKMVKFADLFEMGPDIHMGEFQRWLDSRTEAVRAWSQTNQKKITEIFEFGPDPQIGIISEQMDKAAKSIGGQLEKVFSSLPDTLARAFEGGGDFAGAFKSIGVQIADAISEPLIKSMTKIQKVATAAGATAATALGGHYGGGMGATVAGIASGLGGAALAASAWGTSMTAAGVAGTVALGAATLGIGAAAVGVALLAKHFLTVSKDIKEARKQLEDFNKSMNETLTRQQQLEAGGQQWAATLIQVRDAMLALGVPLEQALAQSQALVKQLLNTDDPRRSRAAMEQIAALMQRLELAKESAGGIFDDIVDLAEQGIPDFLQPMIDQLIELGLLTDEQEKQLRELAGAGSTNWKKIEDAAAKYGIRLESLGQPFNAQRIGADAASIINAFTAITNAGGDVGGVLFDMQDEISKVVQDSQQFGTTIPAKMKPWIEELIRAGLLVDKDGKKITDMGKIQFGDEIETEAEKTRKAFEGITKAIQDLIDTLKGLPSSVNLPTVDRSGSGGGGGGEQTIPGPGERNAPTFAPSSAPGGRVSAMIAATGGATSKTTFNVPIQVDGRTIADVVIDQMGNRLSVRGAR